MTRKTEQRGYCVRKARFFLLTLMRGGRRLHDRISVTNFRDSNCLFLSSAVLRMLFFGTIAAFCFSVGTVVRAEDVLPRDRSTFWFDPYRYCETHGCRKGPSIFDPPILNQEWQPFESKDQVVWGADACLGYFLTKDASAWNGGTTKDEVGDEYGIYVVLGDFLARLHIFDWPPTSVASPYKEYGVFQCENTRWPEHALDAERSEELKKWAEFRLSKANGWVGSIESFAGYLDGSFRNDALGLTIHFENYSGARVRFEADYWGPPVLIDETDGLY